MNYRGYLVYSGIFIKPFILIYIIIRVIKIIRARKINWFREITRFAFIIYIAELISVTMFPVFVDFGSKLGFFPILYEKRCSSVFINLNPFYYHFDHASLRTIMRNVLGNLLLMLPYTILLPFNFRKMRKWQTAIGTAFLTSVCIELLQLVLQITMLNPSRATDINDVIGNVAGAAVGYVLFRFVFSKIPIFKPFIIGREENKPQLQSA